MTRFPTNVSDMFVLKKIKSALLWFIRPKRYEHLYRTIRAEQPRAIMEIGTWNGERAVRMLNLAGKFHGPGEIHYYGFDLFEEMTPEKFEEEISKFPPIRQEVQEKLGGTGAHIHLYQGDTTITMPPLVGNLPKMDFVFLDGGHSIKTITNDWACVQQVMHEGTVVIFDDYWEGREDEGAKAIVDQIDRNRYDVQILDPQDCFKREWGTLKINLVRVTRKPENHDRLPPILAP